MSMGRAMTETPVLEQHIILQLRSLARTAASPSDILFYLVPYVANQDHFVAYLLAAFGDESIMWTIATRWWRGAYPDRAADRALRYALDQTRPWWANSD
jgi:hypothetical protein